MRAIISLGFAILLSATAWAEEAAMHEDEVGTLNPPDSGRDMLVRKIESGGADSVTCSLGFNAVKYDDDLHLAMELARRCAEAGNVKAMTWISQLESNGAAGAPNLKAAAEWDRRAAEAGDPVGRFNHGLNLIRGTGLPRDEALGRSFIDRAAEDGLDVAKRLKAADYDLDEVTPSAEDRDQAPVF